MDIHNPFETFQKYAFRLEGLPHYRVDSEKGAFDEFQKTGKVDFVDNEWRDMVARATKAGKRVERLRLLSEEPTEYERFELLAYAGLSAGEDIRTALRSDYLDHYLYDFWFFDDEWIAQLAYTADGSFIDIDVRSATEAECHMYRFWRDVYVQSPKLHVVPLDHE